MNDHQLDHKVDKCILVDMGVKQKHDHIISTELVGHFNYLREYHQTMKNKEYK